jgi:hypothetical protein
MMNDILIPRSGGRGVERETYPFSKASRCPQEANHGHSAPSNTSVKNEGYVSLATICCHGVHKENFTKASRVHKITKNKTE